MSEKGNYMVAVIKTKDDYEGIHESLSALDVSSCLFASVNAHSHEKVCSLSSLSEQF